MSEPVQIFVRNDKGKVWGPLTPATVELLLDNGLIEGRIQVATDGATYMFPGRVPHIRQYIPRALWGDVVVPGPDLDAPPPPPPPVPKELGGQDAGPAVVGGDGAAADGAAPMAGPGTGPTAGPGAAPRAGPGVGPRAGPGAAPRAGPGTAPRPGPGVAQRPGPSAARPAGPPRAPPQMAGVAARPAARPGAPIAMAPVVEAQVVEAEVLEASVVEADVISAEAEVLTAEPEVLTAEPEVLAAEPEVLAAEPEVLAEEPEVLAGDAPEPAPRRPQVAKPARAPKGPPPVVRPAPSPVEAPSQMPPKGLLSDTHPVQLYFIAASTDANGLLSVKTPELQLQLHFKKGNPEFFESTHPDDELAGFLVRQGALSPDQLAQAQAKLDQFGGELVAALFGLGLVNPATAFAHLASRAGAILLRFLLAEVGTFKFEPGELPAARAMPLGNKWGLMTEQVRKIPIQELRRRLGEAMDMPVMKSGGRIQAQDLKLTPQETRAYSHFDGVRSLAQLAEDLPADADNALRIAWYLRQCDLASFADVKVPVRKAAPPPEDPGPEAGTQPGADGPAAAPKPAAPAAAKPGAPAAAKPGAPAAAKAGAPAAAKPSAPAAAKPAAPAAAKPAAPAASKPPASKPAAPEAANDVASLEAMLRKVKEQNLFQVLNVPQTADAAQIRTAYLKLARAYHPDTVPPGTPEAVATLKAEIFARIGEAQRVLLDEAARAEHVAEIEAGTSEKVDVVRILAAEDAFQRGSIMVKARKFAEAVKVLDEAIAGNPDEGEYYAWRGYAKFFAATDKKAAHPEALRDVNLCISKNPKCAPAFYFLGHMAKVLGDVATAKKNFSKCLELSPDHLDAQRELRHMK